MMIRKRVNILIYTWELVDVCALRTIYIFFVSVIYYDQLKATTAT